MAVLLLCINFYCSSLFGERQFIENWRFCGLGSISNYSKSLMKFDSDSKLFVRAIERPNFSGVSFYVSDLKY